MSVQARLLASTSAAARTILIELQDVPFCTPGLASPHTNTYTNNACADSTAVGRVSHYMAEAEVVRCGIAIGRISLGLVVDGSALGRLVTESSTAVSGPSIRLTRLLFYIVFLE